MPFALRITINGRTQSQGAWAREYGIPVNTVRSRLRVGWTLIDALTAPVKPSNTSDLTGTHGNITILRIARFSLRKGAPRLWECECKCGKMLLRKRHDIKLGRGCASCGSSLRTHGLSHLPEAKVLSGMIKRCTNPKCNQYKDYGGRGIVVCDEWYNSFPAFLNDVGPRPSPKHTIERINNNGNYEPGNCRWATQLEQQHNRRSNRLITHNGETKCVAEWAISCGLRYMTLIGRLNRGWTPPHLFIPPQHAKYREICYHTNGPAGRCV